MCNVHILDEDAFSRPEGFIVANYTNKVFKMYDREEQNVVLKCHNSVMKGINDRFGDKVYVSRINDEHFCVEVHVSVSKTFFSWLFQYTGKIEVMEPSNVKNDYLEMARKVLGITL